MPASLTRFGRCGDGAGLTKPLFKWRRYLLSSGVEVEVGVDVPVVVQEPEKHPHRLVVVEAQDQAFLALPCDADHSGPQCVAGQPADIHMYCMYDATHDLRVGKQEQNPKPQRLRGTGQARCGGRTRLGSIRIGRTRGVGLGSGHAARCMVRLSDMHWS